MRWPRGIVLFVALSCSSTAGDTLDGSLSSIYDISFNSVQIIVDGTQVQVTYLGDNGVDPAQLSVQTANLVSVAGVAINLVQPDSGNGQLRGTLYYVGAAGSATQPLPIQQGTVTFNEVPTVGQTVSGSFAATLSSPSGYTLDGTFSAKATAP